jgi:hypothetical protein
MVSDAHNVITKGRYVILDIPQEDLEGISGIDHPNRLGLLVNYRNMHKAALFHFRQDIVQRVTGVAVGDISRHHSFRWGRAATSFTVSDLSNDIGLADDTDRRSVKIAHDQKALVRVA